MAYSESLAARVRAILKNRSIEEKKMFGGLAFMVNGKMCVAVGKDDLMCRIDPAFHEQAVEKEGVNTVMMGGKQYRGYVNVDESSLADANALEYWISLALDYNKYAKATKSKKNKTR